MPGQSHESVHRDSAAELLAAASVGDFVAGRRVLHMPADASVREAAEFMSMMHMGAILVVDDGVMVGIFTERDLLTRVVARGRDPETTLLCDAMTRELVSVEPATSVRDALGLMLSDGIRHLPVLEGERLAGIISLRDIVGLV